MSTERLAVHARGELFSSGMRRGRRYLHSRFGTAVRVVATVLAMTHALLAFAPLAERADSRVAAVHVEEAGTSTHHAHGELCALCAASHLVATPARASLTALFPAVGGQPIIARRYPSTAAELLDTRPRAPPA